jgi:hypothetical protein
MGGIRKIVDAYLFIQYADGAVYGRLPETLQPVKSERSGIAC